MRVILKFSELAVEDKKKRYRYMVELPGTLLLSIMYMSRVPLIWLTTTVSVIMLANLFLFGLKERKSYTLHVFLQDTLVLILFNMTTVFLLTPIVMDGINRMIHLESYFLSVFIAYLLLNALWYFAIYVERKLVDESVYWKWKVSNVLSHYQSKIDQL